MARSVVILFFVSLAALACWGFRDVLFGVEYH